MLLVGGVNLTAAAPAHAEGPPMPRGPEVAIDPVSRFCPDFVRLQGGGVALAYSLEEGDALRERVVARIAVPDGSLGPRTLLDRDSEGLLDILGIANTQQGPHVLWRHLDYELETWRDATIDAQAALQDGPRVLRNVGLNGAPTLLTRQVGGFVESWWKGVTLHVRILDDDLNPRGETQAVKVPDATGALLLERPSGAFVALIGQLRRRSDGGVGLRLQRFDRDGRPAGPLLRLLAPHWSFNGIQATLRDDGTLAVAADYGDLFGSSLLTLWTFGPDGALSGLRYRYDPKGRSSSQSVALDPEGRVLWVWYDPNAKGRYRAEVSDLGGVALGPSFSVPTKSNRARGLLGCAHADWSGEDWVVVWSSPDWQGSKDTAYVRRFARSRSVR